MRTLLARLRPERAALYRDAAFRPPASSAAPGSLAVLLSPRYRRTSLTIWLAAFLSLFCIFGLTGWVPTVMIRRGESFGASFGFGALMQIMSFVGFLCCGYVADRRGSSRVALAIWWTLGAATMLFLAHADSHLANVVGITGAGFLVIGPQFVLNNFTAQSYETELRASAVGTELGVGRIGAILGPFLIGLLQQVFHGAGRRVHRHRLRRSDHRRGHPAAGTRAVVPDRLRGAAAAARLRFDFAPQAALCSIAIQGDRPWPNIGQDTGSAASGPEPVRRRTASAPRPGR